MSFFRGLRFACLLSAIVVGISFATPAQSGQSHPPQDTWQNPGPIDGDADRGQSDVPIPKGAAAIEQVNAKCSTTLIVAADALFKRHRWTLNFDAGETMDVLGKLVAKAGKHPARIESFTDSLGPESDNQSVTEKRAITVRGWLVNHGLVPQSTLAEGFGSRNPVAPNDRPDGSDNPTGRQKNRRIEIVIDTCK